MEPGFYWVYIKDNYHDEWTIGEFTGGDWYLLGSDEFFDTGYFHKIGPKIERPAECL